MCGDSFLVRLRSTESSGPFSHSDPGDADPIPLFPIPFETAKFPTYKEKCRNFRHSFQKSPTASCRIYLIWKSARFFKAFLISRTASFNDHLDFEPQAHFDDCGVQNPAPATPRLPACEQKFERRFSSRLRTRKQVIACRPIQYVPPSSAAYFI
jgi:hypothetical protein